MMNYYTAGHFFSHKGIIKIENRIFYDIEDMDVFMIKVWNSVVGKGDTVYHLGDFCFGPEDRTRVILERLNGEICLMRSPRDDVKTLMKCGLRDIRSEFLVRDGDKMIMMSHHAQPWWEGKERGDYHFHGYDSTRSVPLMKRRFDVSVGLWNYYPKTAEQIISGEI